MSKGQYGNRRALWHDYRSRRIYHITLMKHPEAPTFGKIIGDWRLPVGANGSSHLSASPLGNIIKTCLRELPDIHPALHLYQYALMPDHLHLLLSVEYPLDEILGRKIAAFKVLVNSRSGIAQVFDKGFNDQILNPRRSLNGIFNYLRANPYRLAVRHAHPDFFTRSNAITIKDTTLQTYGNLHLLANPFKEQVVIHRTDAPELLENNRNRWLHTAANGGVLISPFISRAEKAIRAEAELLGAKIMLITHEAFPERFKPSKHDFEQCAAGRLLIISLGLNPETTINRDLCLRMNFIARELSSRSRVRIKIF